MKELIFQVEFLSDIVLPASSNTEGKIDQLDFIAGSNFLGMVARNYEKFQNSFDIFHSGKVQFGDAHILKDEQQVTYKIPYSYFHKKLQSETIYNHHLLTEADFELENKGGLGQLKQLRNGYITENNECIFIDYVYSQKSAYDNETRTSKEGQMYGYKAIKKGSKWQFAVKLSNDVSKEDEKLIVETLKSSTRLGRSKSAEYGQVKIEQKESSKSLSNIATLAQEAVLYCNSRLALTNENGNPTYDLKYLCEGLDIVYEKTQIRTATFTPYNGVRQAKDYERVCINKGSVVVVKNLTAKQLETIKQGVGAFKSEGFGEIIINPSFLMEKEFKLVKECKDKSKKDERQKIIQTFKDNPTVQFLVNRHNKSIDALEIANEVAMFVEKHKKSIFSNIKPSQWGNIRSIASNYSDDFIKKIETYISNGTRKWENNQISILMNSISSHAIDKQKFTKLLAMKMGGKNDSK